MNYVVSQGWALYWGTAKWTPVEVSIKNNTKKGSNNKLTQIFFHFYHGMCMTLANI